MSLLSWLSYGTSEAQNLHYISTEQALKTAQTPTTATLKIEAAPCVFKLASPEDGEFFLRFILKDARPVQLQIKDQHQKTVLQQTLLQKGENKLSFEAQANQIYTAVLTPVKDHLLWVEIQEML